MDILYPSSELYFDYNYGDNFLLLSTGEIAIYKNMALSSFII